jgi:hypothetical protein
METIMVKMLVGTYRTRRDADDARQQLLERGFNDSQISVEGPGAEEHGLSAWIARMFSGLLPDKAEHERYERALRTGSVLVAVHRLDEAAAQRAKPILERAGVVDEHTQAAAAETWTPRHPEETPLPNAPSAWNEASPGERASTGRGTPDPARPEGLARGTDELGASEDRDRLRRP